jgi:hypothetical protein
MKATMQISHEEHHRALVKRLSREITPSRPLWPVTARLAVWGGLDVVGLGWVMTHTRNDFAAKLIHPLYFIEVVFFASAAVISAALALKSAVPGRTVSRNEAIMTTALVLTATIVVMIAQPIDTADQLGDFARIGVRCARETVTLGALPWLVLWWLVRRGAPMSGGLSGLFVGSGALLWSFAMMRIGCPIDEPLHLLVWHLSPALAVIALSTLAGVRGLRFRPRPRYPTAPE